jgi:hypothetical protein
MTDRTERQLVARVVARALGRAGEGQKSMPKGGTA